MFDIKRNKGFVITLAVALVLIIAGVVLWRGAESGAVDAEGDLESYESSYQSVVTTYGGEPTEELVDKYESDTAALKEAAKELRAAAPRGELPTFTPNGFKDEVKTLQNKFYAVSGDKNISIPQDIGEGQWLGPEMPTEAELPKLIRQLVLIRDVLGVLLDGGVVEINAVDRNPQGLIEDETSMMDIDVVFDGGPAPRTARTQAEAKGKEHMYTAVPVMFNFRVPPQLLPELLVKIRNAPHFYRVRSITTTSEIESVGELQDPADVDELLAVELVVDHVLLSPAPGSDT
jgi:hypothetical protein